MARHTPDPSPSVAREMVRSLGLAPSLNGLPVATQQLIDCIREDIDLTAERAKARLAIERRETHEQALGPDSWGTGTGSTGKGTPE